MTRVPSTPAPVVLIVDDSATNLHVLNRILGARYQVKVARSGLKALDIAVRVRPSLILLDVQMPDMDGIEVCRRLKQDSATAAIPVAFVSGDGGAQDLAACRAAGGSDFFIKPVDPEDLLARAARLIGR